MPPTTTSGKKGVGSGHTHACETSMTDEEQINQYNQVNEEHPGRSKLTVEFCWVERRE